MGKNSRMEKKNESSQNQILVDSGLSILVGFVGPLESICQTLLAFSVFFLYT